MNRYGEGRHTYSKLINYQDVFISVARQKASTKLKNSNEICKYDWLWKKKNVRQLMLYDRWMSILQFSSLDLNSACITRAVLFQWINKIFNFCHQQWVKSKYRIFRHSRFHYMIWVFSFQPQKSTFTIEICNIRFEILISNKEMDKNETLYSHDQKKSVQ